MQVADRIPTTHCPLMARLLVMTSGNAMTRSTPVNPRVATATGGTPDSRTHPEVASTTGPPMITIGMPAAVVRVSTARSVRRRTTARNKCPVTITSAITSRPRRAGQAPAGCQQPTVRRGSAGSRPPMPAGRISRPLLRPARRLAVLRLRLRRQAVLRQAVLRQAPARLAPAQRPPAGLAARNTAATAAAEAPGRDATPSRPAPPMTAADRRPATPSFPASGRAARTPKGAGGGPSAVASGGSRH